MSRGVPLVHRRIGVAREAAAALLVAVLALPVLVAPARAAVVFREVETLERPGTVPVRQVREVSAEGDSCRIQQLESADPVAPAGTWLLVTPNDAFVVDPARRTLAPLEPTSLQPADAAPDDAADATITGVTLELLVDERGQPVLGLATRYAVHRLRYTVQARGADPVPHEERHETWAAELPWLPEVPPGWRAWRVAEDAGAAPERRELRDALDALHARGFVLRHIVERREGGGEGSVTARVTREVTALAEAALPADAFQRPAGYAIEEFLAPPDDGAPEPERPAPGGPAGG